MKSLVEFQLSVSIKTWTYVNLIRNKTVVVVIKPPWMLLTLREMLENQ